VGAVTCLYTARPAVPCLAGRLGCLQINDWFLPSVLSAEVTGDVDFCLGSSIAMRRDALDAIGGFRALRNVLADDYTLGRTLVERGYRVILSDCLVETVVAETELTALLRHELRWARTIRAVRPLSFAGSILTNTITLSLVVALSLVLAGANPTLGLAVVAAAILARLVLHHEVGRRFAASNGASWLLPLRDLLSTAVWAASYLGRDVNWRGRALTVDRGGILMNKTE
jgi:ceramide glucosyltransferase